MGGLVAPRRQPPVFRCCRRGRGLARGIGIVAVQELVQQRLADREHGAFGADAVEGGEQPDPVIQQESQIAPKRRRSTIVSDDPMAIPMVLHEAEVSDCDSCTSIVRSDNGREGMSKVKASRSAEPVPAIVPLTIAAEPESERGPEPRAASNPLALPSESGSAAKPVQVSLRASVTPRY